MKSSPRAGWDSQKNRKRRHAPAGYTLMEIMLVVAIIAGIAGGGVINMAGIPVVTEIQGSEQDIAHIYRALKLDVGRDNQTPDRREGRAGARPGFTLLEVCFVLFIVAVVVGVAPSPAARLFQEGQLRRPVRELQGFAKEARRSAIVENRSYQLLLLNDRFVLQPADQKIDDQRSEASYRLASDVTFAIKRLNDTGFNGSADQRWIFSPNGLGEPF